MVRRKGTLRNFLGDGNITTAGIKWCILTGKIAVGQEMTMLIDADQLKAWGIWVEVKK